MNPAAAVSGRVVLKRFRSPKTVVSRFIIRHTTRGAALWALGFGVYVASKAIGFVDLYPTAIARQKIAETFSNNIGIELILGRAPNAATTGAYTAWNTLGIMVTVGSIWALLLVTKYFRGEEDAGRSEVLLAGQTTPRKLSLNIFSGIITSLSVFYIILALIFTMVGKSKGVGFDSESALFFSLAVVVGIAMFMSLGALASQLMPTRSRAAGMCGVILGICVVLKAIADVTSARWLLDFNPLGWVEKLQPLYHSQPIWLIPIVSLIVAAVSLTIFFAGKRDLGDSIFADKASVKPKTSLLNSPFATAFRLTRSNSLGWLTGILISSTLFGLITKSTSQIFGQSKTAEHVLSRLAQQVQVSSATQFLGVVFLFQMALIMAYAASSIAAIRKEEADSYLDNFLVLPFSRLRWLSGRLMLILGVVVASGILTTLGTWIGVASQHIGIPFNTIVLASVNALVPVALTIGVGIFAFGIRPRLTSVMAYAVLTWSFLIEMLSSGLKLNHWILDTSVLHQITLAPATDPNWHINVILVIISIILCFIGALVFNNRDLENE